MTLSWSEAEASVQDSAPREAYEIISRPESALVARTYRIAYGTRPIVIDGKTYLPSSPVQREDIKVATVNDEEAALVFMLPINHQLPQRYMLNGIPQSRIFVNVYRAQVGGDFRIIWRGYVTAMTPSRHVAKFLVPERMNQVLAKRLPTSTAGRACVHILYDQNCRVDRDTYTRTVTATYVDGTTVRADVALDDQWARGGELVHVESGEPMTITSQTSSSDLDGSHVEITIQFQIAELKVGDTIEIVAGCDHQITTCAIKFENQGNYGGFPHMPLTNPHIPTGLGILSS